MNLATGIILLSSFLGLSLLGAPIAFALGAAALFVMAAIVDVPLQVIILRMTTSIESYTLLAVPMFILTANLMNASGATDKIFHFTNRLVGHLRGGLGQVNILASLIFSGMSGSALADTAGLGRIEIKFMTNKGYDLGFSTAVTAASALIGPVFPPSIPIIIYAMLVDQSVGRLLVGGVIPGLLMALLLGVTVFIICLKKNYPREPKANLRQIGSSFLEAFPSLFTVIILLGGFLFGIFTPTEASAMAAVYAFILATVVYRKLKARDVLQVLFETGLTTGTLMLIFMFSSVFAWLITSTDLPAMLSGGIAATIADPRVVILLIVLVAVVMGCFIDALPNLMLLVPVIAPLMDKYSLDPIAMGVILVIAVMIGILTPPVGMGLFIVSEISGLSVPAVSKNISPYLLTMAAFLLLLVFFPSLITYLPGIVFGD